MEPVGAFGSRKVAEERFRKHVTNSRDKRIKNYYKYVPKRGSHIVMILSFLGSPSQDGLQGVPGPLPRPKNILK